MQGLADRARELGKILQQRRFSVVTAESCTGGGIARLLTDEPGASSWFERGFVTYSNLSKEEMLGVPRSLLETHGAVSEEVALAMARGALAHSNGDVSISVSGVAGPDGGTAEKPGGGGGNGCWFAGWDSWTVSWASAPRMPAPTDRS